MTARLRLPNRRICETVRFEHDGHRYYGTFSRFGDGHTGELAEVFLDGGKPGSGLQTTARDGAVAISLGLQHGCTVETLKGAMARLDDGSAAGPLGKLIDIIGVDR